MQRFLQLRLESELSDFVARAAARECRTKAAQVRFYIVEAMRGEAATVKPPPSPWPPPAPRCANTPEGIAEAQAQLAAWRPEYAALRKLLANPNGGWTGKEEQRLAWLRDAILTLEHEVKIAQRMGV